MGKPSDLRRGEAAATQREKRLRLTGQATDQIDKLRRSIHRSDPRRPPRNRRPFTTVQNAVSDRETRDFSSAWRRQRRRDRSSWHRVSKEAGRDRADRLRVVQRCVRNPHEARPANPALGDGPLLPWSRSSDASIAEMKGAYPPLIMRGPARFEPANLVNMVGTERGCDATHPAEIPAKGWKRCRPPDL